MRVTRRSGRQAARSAVAVVMLAAGVAATGGPGAAAQAVNLCPKPSGTVNYYAPGHGKTVALTFDDGPGRSTAQVLHILETHHVPATFFNLGDQVAEWKGAVRRELVDGDVIGDHTWDHADLETLTDAQQRPEIDREIAAQRQVIGLAPCVFRPPYGAYDKRTLRLAAQRHMAVWLWSVDPQDWKADGSGSPQWVHRVTSGAEAGLGQRHPVVLLHNMAGGNPATVAALPAIIHAYRSHGYRFVQVMDPRADALTG
jgi:peptidoglycan/xylan/chitin deacetylase (PgdA/CDA1 family)